MKTDDNSESIFNPFEIIDGKRVSVAAEQN